VAVALDVVAAVGARLGADGAKQDMVTKTEGAWRDLVFLSTPLGTRGG
jgi:hypothetical protein